MKRVLVALVAFLLAAPFALSVPADPTPYKYRQPDGTVIILQNHGDEYFHWTTDAAGRVVEKGDDGFYRIALEPLRAKASRAMAKRPAKRMWSSYETAPETNFGDRKVLCIIANFTDSTFVIENPNEHFTNMLNKEGYNYNGAIGSVRDYFMDNSWNGTESVYRPQFGVYGPVTLTHSSAYYDLYGVDLAILEAYELMKDQIPIADYDTDNNGTVDMVLFYYPGHNQAEGAGVESIWPHQSEADFGKMGDKDFVRYFCTSELRGASGTEAASIGTTCHEFSHSLGLPDFYDTDYEESGYNRFTTAWFDLMSNGSYNDYGRRPPYLSAMERNMLGWQEAPELISVSGDYMLAGVQTPGTLGYRINGRMDGEYYILECRNGLKWDSGIVTYSDIEKGLLIYHVDQTPRVVSYGYTAQYLWSETNDINRYGPEIGGHPCYTLLVNCSPEEVNYANPNYRIFPGYYNVTSVSLQDWENLSLGADLSGISYDEGSKQVSVHVELASEKTIYGCVTDKMGAPMEGVQVTLSRSAYPFAAAPSVLPTDLISVTDANGYYGFSFDPEESVYQIVTASKDGYVSVSQNLMAGTRFSRYDFTLFVPGDGGTATLQRYDGFKGRFNSSISSSSHAVGFYYPAAELAEMKAIGSLVESIDFTGAARIGDFEKVYVIVDFSNDIRTERQLELDVTDLYQRDKPTTVDVSAYNITIPEGEDIYVGYGYTGFDLENGYKYPFLIAGPDEDITYGNLGLDDFLNSSNWYLKNWGGMVYSYIVSAQLSLVAPITPATYGISYIDVVENLPTVVPAAWKTIKSIEWYLDGALVDGTPTAVNALSAGSHTYMARLVYYDGTFERVYYDLEVE